MGLKGWGWVKWQERSQDQEESLKKKKFTLTERKGNEREGWP